MLNAENGIVALGTIVFAGNKKNKGSWPNVSKLPRRVLISGIVAARLKLCAGCSNPFGKRSAQVLVLDIFREEYKFHNWTLLVLTQDPHLQTFHQAVSRLKYELGDALLLSGTNDHIWLRLGDDFFIYVCGAETLERIAEAYDQFRDAVPGAPLERYNPEGTVVITQSFNEIMQLSHTIGIGLHLFGARP
jgi:hypothetical protein